MRKRPDQLKLPSPLNLENIVAFLRSCGCRMTESRKGILECLLRSERPLSLEEIQNASAEILGKKQDFATVFRTLIQLEELGLARKVPVGKSMSYYELCDPEKHKEHIVCRQCGKIVTIEITCPIPDSLYTELEQRYGFHGLTHMLTFYGICSECYAKQGAGESQPSAGEGLVSASSEISSPSVEAPASLPEVPAQACENQPEHPPVQEAWNAQGGTYDPAPSPEFSAAAPVAEAQAHAPESGQAPHQENAEQHAPQAQEHSASPSWGGGEQGGSEPQYPS